MDRLLKSRKSPIFEIARMKIQSIQEELDNEVRPFELEKNKWFKILPTKENSPLIMQISETTHLIYYPQNSASYHHSLETKCKFVEILSGVIFDESTGKRYVKGDRLKVFPGEQLRPYTTNSEAYVKVCIGDCKSIWDQICE